MSVPIILAVALAAILGTPTDVEAAAGMAGVAFAACTWVGAVFAWRWVLTLWLRSPTESDLDYREFLASMAGVATTVGVLMLWRFGSFSALAIPSETLEAWFKDNRIIAVVIVGLLALSMGRKLAVPMRKALGPWWVAVVGSGAVGLFFAIIAILRLV